MVQYVEKPYTENFTKITEPGRYEVQVKSMQIKDNKSGTGQLLSLILSTKDNASYFVNLNISNPNEMAVQVSYGSFLKLLRATQLLHVIEEVKELEAKANTYNELFESIVRSILDKLPDAGFFDITFILELYKFKNKNNPTVFNALTNEMEENFRTGEKFLSVEEDVIPF